VSANAEEALAHVAEAVAALHGLVHTSLQLLQADFFRASASAAAHPPTLSAAVPDDAALAAVGTVDELRALQAGTLSSTLPGARR
jgi:hypothetical protein